MQNKSGEEDKSRGECSSVREYRSVGAVETGRWDIVGDKQCDIPKVKIEEHSEVAER